MNSLSGMMIPFNREKPNSAAIGEHEKNILIPAKD